MGYLWRKNIEWFDRYSLWSEENYKIRFENKMEIKINYKITINLFEL